MSDEQKKSLKAVATINLTEATVGEEYPDLLVRFTPTGQKLPPGEYRLYTHSHEPVSSQMAVPGVLKKYDGYVPPEDGDAGHYYVDGWNDCRDAMLAAPRPVLDVAELVEEARSMLAAAPHPAPDVAGLVEARGDVMRFALSEMVKWYENIPLGNNPAFQYYDLAKKALLSAAAPAAPAVQGEPVGWRSIKEEKPADGQDCITKMKHGIIQGTYSSEDDAFSGYYWRNMEWYATHWAPAEEAIYAAPQPVEQQPISHDWDDQDKCRRCGDRDWYASATCTPKQQQPAPAVQGEPVAAQVRYRRPEKGLPSWSAWQPAKVDETEPTYHFDEQGWESEYRLLYATPQPAPDVAGLVEALEHIASWPDGGNRSGQPHIKMFAAKTLAAHRKQGGEHE